MVKELHIASFNILVLGLSCQVVSDALNACLNDCHQARFLLPIRNHWMSSMLRGGDVHAGRVVVGEGRAVLEGGERWDAREEGLVQATLLSAQTPGMSWGGRGFLAALGRQSQKVC